MALSETGQTVPEGSTDNWQDKKRYLWLFGLVIPSARSGPEVLTVWQGS